MLLKRLRYLGASVLLLLCTLFSTNLAHSQVSITATGSYTQDFNSLPSSGTSNSWQNNVTLPNWYGQSSGTTNPTTIIADAGTNTTGSYHSYGAVGSNDRALGTLASNGTGDIAYGVLLRNNSSSTITEMTVAYTMEQWRNGGNTATQSILFYYKVDNAPITSSLNPGSGAGWTAVPALNASSLVASSTAAALNGNDPSNRVVIPAVSLPSLNLAPGQYIFLKWDDLNNTGNDHGLSIDDLTITWTVAAAEPPVVVDPFEDLLGNVGSVFSYQIEASNEPSGFSIVDGELPAGVSLNTITGLISGTPTVAGYFSVAIAASNTSGEGDPVWFNLNIDMGTQTISFDPIPAATYGDPNIVLPENSSAGLPITYYSSNALVATISGNEIVIVGVGSTTITATQDGDENYYPAPNVSHTLTVSKASQTITFGSLADKYTNDPDFELTASASSGLSVSYSSSNTDVATISGNIVTIVGSGTTIITASQAGNDYYEAATSVDQTLLVIDASKLDQTITFGALSDATYGDAPFALSATASSGLAVSYLSSNTDVATISGNIVTIVGIGSTTITALQSGDDDYNPATPVEQTLTVNQKALTISGLAVEDKVYDGTTAATLDLSGATLVGVVGFDDVSFTGTAEFETSGAGSSIPVILNLNLTGNDVGYYTLVTPDVTGTILQASQTISFDALPNKTTNDAPFQLSATASSGLTVTYVSDNPSVATISGDMVTIVGAGVANITAYQDGDANYEAATPVAQSLTVTLAPSVVTWNFGTTSANPYPSSGVPVNHLTISAFDQGFNVNSSQTSLQLNTSSASNPVPQYSGQYNASITANNTDFHPYASTYFEFALMPDEGYKVELTHLSLASRSTSTGPNRLALRTSADGFGSDVQVLTAQTNSAWATHTFTFDPITYSYPLIVRIYGYQEGGPGTLTPTSANNWRIDDVSIQVLVKEHPVCSEAPNAGTLTAAETTFCESGSTTLTVTGHTSADDVQGLVYQWFSSTDDLNYSPTGGGSGNTLNTGELTTTTYYYFLVGCPGINEYVTSNRVAVVINNATKPTISGSNIFCANGGTSTLTASGSNVSSFQWYLNGSPVGINSSTYAASVAGTYSVEITDVNGCTAMSDDFVLSETTSTPAPIIEGPTNVCEFVGTGENVVFSIVPIEGATSYTWTLPPSVTYVSGQGTSTLTVTINSNFPSMANKQIRAVAHSSCGTSPITIKYLNAQAPVTPKPIAGPNNVCDYIDNDYHVVYSVEPVIAATDYIWSLPPGMNMVANNGNSITVTFSSSFTSSSLTVFAMNQCGVSGSRSLMITRVNPSTPSLINGSNNACVFMPTESNPSGSTSFYWIPVVSNATDYIWTVPAGATIVDHYTNWTESVIEVAFNSDFAGGAISVQTTNNCGVSGVRSMNLSILMPGAPGDIDVVEVESCPDRVYSYSLANMPSNTTSLEWTIPSGATLLEGQGSTSILVSYPSTAVVGTVTVKAVNGCGSSAVRSRNIKLAACETQAMKLITTTTLMNDDNSLVSSIYPNPSNTDFRVNLHKNAGKKVTVKVMDITGATIQQYQSRAGEMITVGAQLKPGVYFIEVSNGQDRKVTKVIKQ